MKDDRKAAHSKTNLILVSISLEDIEIYVGNNYADCINSAAVESIKNFLVNARKEKQ